MRSSLGCALGVIVFSASVGFCTSHNGSKEEFNPDTGAELMDNLGGKLKTAWNWLEAQERNGDNFVGEVHNNRDHVVVLRSVLSVVLKMLFVSQLSFS